VREEKLRQILKLFEESGIEELELEHSFWRGTRIRLSRRRAAEVVAPLVQAPVEVAASSVAPEPKESVVEDGLHQVLSPMVGTFYRASSPESEVFVSGGASVKAGQALCIIEAMKIMNEIPADVAGEVVEILVEDGEPVEYNQPLFKIRPS
jgi:acetyl-CoA carboxylase biotin carboxyl carrier protein